MKNALEKYRRQHKLTYRALAEMCKGLSLYSVYRDCKGDKITAEAAIIYAKNLDIKLSEMRPDLWPTSCTEENSSVNVISTTNMESLGE